MSLRDILQFLLVIMSWCAILLLIGCIQWAGEKLRARRLRRALCIKQPPAFDSRDSLSAFRRDMASRQVRR